MLLKVRSEDFIVEEYSKRYGLLKINKKYKPINLEEKADHLVCILIKKDVETFSFINKFSRFFGISPLRLSFSGTKDKKAYTSQLFSIYRFNHEKLSLFKMDNITIIPLEYSPKKVRLGEHIGNFFTITIRKLNKQDIEKLEKLPKEIYFPNYYGSQRFGEGVIKSWMIGEAIIKRKWKLATNLIIKGAPRNNNGEIKGYERKLYDYLFHHHNQDHLGALKSLPLHVLQMYVHSFQSYVFNKVLTTLWNELEKEETITVPGYEFEGYAVKDKKEKMIEEIMKKYNIKPEMFRIPELNIKSEGLTRHAWAKASNFNILEVDKDDLFPDHYKVVVEFFLPKGSYATVFLEEVLK